MPQVCLKFLWNFLYRGFTAVPWCSWVVWALLVGGCAGVVVVVLGYLQGLQCRCVAGFGCLQMCRCWLHIAVASGGCAIAMCRGGSLQGLLFCIGVFAVASGVAIASIPWGEYLLTCFAQGFAIVLQVQKRD